MTTTVKNKTRRPLSVPLGRGKKLYLGPGKSGEIAAHDAEQPGVKSLIESGSIEIVVGRGRSNAGGGETKGRASGGHTAIGGPHRGGDR